MKVVTINVDRNLPANHFDGMPKDTLAVKRLFYTFQGEGPYAGHPALFIRLIGCNIGAKQDCPWCDTDFSDHGDVTTFARLSTLIEATVNGTAHPPGIVITGGEPLLQGEALRRLLTQYKLEQRKPPAFWQIETNGMLYTPELFSGLNVYTVISPKVGHNQNGYRPLRESWLSKPLRTALKFVVDADPLSPYHKLPPNITEAFRARVPVYISGATVYRRAPREGEVASMWDQTLVDHDATAANYRHAANLVLRLGGGARVSYQTHLFGVQE